MYQHPNARLTPLGRRTLWERVESGEGVSSVARDMGVSRRTASKWVGRARRGEGLGDRASRPRRSPTRVPDDERAAVVARRLELRCSALALSAVTGIPTRTCGRIVAQAGCPPLSAYDPVSGALGRTGPVTRVRYEREAPGDLVHVDVKKVARIPEGGGWRAHGRGLDPYGGHSGAGVGCLHVAVDDRSRVAYAEELADERMGTCAAFVLRAAAFYASLGVTVREVMTDNGPGYRSSAFAEAIGSIGASHVFTRPYSP